MIKPGEGYWGAENGVIKLDDLGESFVSCETQTVLRPDTFMTFLWNLNRFYTSLQTNSKAQHRVGEPTVISNHVGREYIKM